MAFKYLNEHRKFIEKNCKGITTAELAELFNEQFKTDITRNQIKCYFANHRLTNGLGGLKFLKLCHQKSRKKSFQVYLNVQIR